MVATPNHTHYAIVAACLAARKHVLCEKPLGINAAEAQELCRQAPQPVFLAFSVRGVPSSLQIHIIGIHIGHGSHMCVGSMVETLLCEPKRRPVLKACL